MSLVVSTHTVAIDAHIVKGRLEAEGIPAFLSEDQHITMDWSLSLALGGVKVRVPEAYKDSALEILQLTEDDEYQLGKFDREALTEEVEAKLVPEIPPECPKCSSSEISKVNWMRSLSLVVIFLFHTPIAFSQRYNRCDDCRYAFRVGKRGLGDFIFQVFWVLSFLLALLMILGWPVSDFSNSSYLSRSNGADMTFFSDTPMTDGAGEEF